MARPDDKFTRVRRADTIDTKNRPEPTFEGDPIGRSLECRPKKGIFILINIKFPLGPTRVIKN